MGKNSAHHLRTLATSCALALVLAACSQSPSYMATEAAAAPPPVEAARIAVEDVAAAESASAGSSASSGAQSGPADTKAQAGTMLAYQYAAALELPLDQVAAMAKAHEKACQEAGPRLCQVLEAGQNNFGDQASANLSLRAEPGWLKAFRDGLQSGAKAAGGRLTSQNVSSEDLTRAIIDSESFLKAQTTLRDRLQALLASRPGKLAELLEVERELARVQGEIDARKSELDVMKARVSMSRLDLNYASFSNPVSQSAFRPVVNAWNGALHAMMGVVGALITLIAILIPLSLLGALVFWAGSRAWNLWKARRTAKANPQDAA